MAERPQHPRSSGETPRASFRQHTGGWAFGKTISLPLGSSILALGPRSSSPECVHTWVMPAHIQARGRTHTHGEQDSREPSGRPPTHRQGDVERASPYLAGKRSEEQLHRMPSQEWTSGTTRGERKTRRRRTSTSTRRAGGGGRRT